MKYMLKIYDKGYVIGELLEKSCTENLIYARVVKNTSDLTVAKVGECWYFQKEEYILAHSMAEIEKILVFQ